MYITPTDHNGDPYPVEVVRDDTPQVEGQHKGPDGSSVLITDDIGSFIGLGVVCYNTTKGTYGLVTKTDKTEITVDGVTWDNGDNYEIYFTSKKNSILSRYLIDRITGERVDFYHNEEIDIPGDEFGPGQPEML